MKMNTYSANTYNTENAFKKTKRSHRLEVCFGYTFRSSMPAFSGIYLAFRFFNFNVLHIQKSPRQESHRDDKKFG